MNAETPTVEPSRNRFHAICPYYAMFPESFAQHWLEKTTKPGDVVLDPFCGRGTLPFQALLMGRRAIGNDVNPVAYVVSHAKTNAPSLAAVRRRLTVLEKQFDEDHWDKARSSLPEFFRVCFHAATLRQILYLRSTLDWRRSNVDCMITAITLGALHGESQKSPSYLSNQMPRTIATKPAYSIRWWKEKGYRAPNRNAFALLRTLVDYRYASTPPTSTATIINGDMRDLHLIAIGKRIRAAITSPPYLNVTNYVEDQWLRLWFLGGHHEPTTKGAVSRDDRYEDPDKYWRMIADMWRMLGQVVDEKGHVVIRIGGKRLSRTEIVSKLEGTAVFSGRSVTLKHHEESPMRRRQTPSFRPGNDVGLASEVDCHFLLR